MFACAASHPDLPTLFDPCVPDHPVLWAVFQGNNTGRALVDDLQHPRQCVLRTDACLTFASRQVNPRFLAASLEHLRHAGDVWLVLPPERAPWPELPEPAAITRRLEFYDCDPTSPGLAALRQSLPPGYTIRPIDRSLLERCEWRSDMEFFCGSLENFLARAAGLCLMRGDEMIAEAYAAPIGATQAEIGAITHAAYRGHGYAPIACAFLVQLCAQRGLGVYWSCDEDNPASARVAQKLGFRQSRAYQTFEYPALADAGE